MPAFPELTEASLVFRSVFSKRVWQSVQILIKGAILAVGPRTVAAVLRVMGLSEDQQFHLNQKEIKPYEWTSLKS